MSPRIGLGLALALALGRSLAAEGGGEAVTLRQLIDATAQGPEARAADAQALKQDQAARAHWRAAFLPKLVAAGLASQQDHDTAIELFPLGALTLPRDSWAAGAMLSQPLLDIEGMLYGAGAADAGAQAAGLAAVQGRKDCQAKAVDWYLQALELRARRLALEAYAANLDSRRDEIQRLFELGGVGEADLLKVKLGVDDARAGARELQAKEAYLAAMLGQAAGQAQPLLPADLPLELPSAEPAAPAGEREDLQALEAQARAADLSAAGAEAGFLPKLSLSATYLRVDQQLLSQQEWVGLGAQVTWTVFDGAVRQAKAKAAEAEAQGLRERRQAALLALGAQRQDAMTLLALKRREYAERRQAVDEAQRAADLEFKRLRQGKASVNNLVDAEDVLKDRREKAALSKVQWWQEWFRLQMSGAGALSLPGGL
jgi:outer membrane protein TolC